MASTASAPAKRLLGATLPGGWRIVQHFPKKPGATGGCFSEGYIVESSTNGARAFLKAMDFSEAAASPDPALAIKAMTDAYVFERDLLRKCGAGHLDRVVQAIDGGSVGTSPSDLVLYLVFELADSDVRQQMVSARKIDVAWRLRTLHQISTGLRQLHGQGIAHQDLKPSNVLLFGTFGSKLGDLGRAAYVGHKPPHEDCEVAGDWHYAPPELLYHCVAADWTTRRLGCDAYLLGSMVVYFFTGLGTTHLLVSELSPVHRPHAWGGTFADVLPYVRDAFGKVVRTFGQHADSALSETLANVVSELCEPDPARRGHPKDRCGHGAPYSLERYTTLFDLLARRWEIGAFAGRRN